MAVTYEALEYGIVKLLKTVKIKDSWKPIITRKAQEIIRNKARYEKIGNKLGVPWDFIGCLHNLESGGNFKTHLHNGDPLTRRTRLVPAGRPKVGNPPFTWEESALDALTMKNFHKIGDWPLSRIAYEAERYNGFGYRRAGRPNSPYVWSGTNHYTRGKYVADGKYSASAVSQQIGLIPLLLTIRDLEKTTIKDIKTESRKLTLVTKARSAIQWLGATISAAFAAGQFEMFQGYVSWVSKAVSNNALVLIVIAAILAWLIFKYVEETSVEDFKNGTYMPSGMNDKVDDEPWKELEDDPTVIESSDWTLSEDDSGSVSQDEGETIIPEPDRSGTENSDSTDTDANRVNPS